MHSFLKANLDFLLFVAFIIALRLIELWIARRNEKWLKLNGAILFGQKHYPFIVAMHVLFIVSLIVEYFFTGHHHLVVLLLIAYILLMIFKIWTLASLGKYWNTKIYRIPGAVQVKRGPYKYLRHPNYLIVVLEIAIIPLVFHLYYTAFIFSVLNAVNLSIRIRQENKVWE